MERNESSKQNVEMFTADGRRTVEQLSVTYDELLRAGWSKVLITKQVENLPSGEVVTWPIYAYISHPRVSQPTLSLWILGGVHGEEPAPCNAFAESIQTLIKHARHGIPIVLLPLLNPSGYHRNWRYQNERRDFHLGQSVTDSEHLLPDIANPNMPRATKPSNDIAKAITSWVLQTSLTYIPDLVLDYHEDEFDVSDTSISGEKSDQSYDTYLYCTGQSAYTDIVEDIARMLNALGFPVLSEGTTRFNEPIRNGVVANAHDGSIDELFASSAYYEDGSLREKYPSPVVITVETSLRPYPDQSTPLVRRVAAQKTIIASHEDLWRKLQKMKSQNR